MIDTSKLLDNWGMFQPQEGNSVTGGKTSITKQPTGGTTMADSTFQYPGQWQQASDLWSNMASGNYSNAGMDWLKNMFQSGGSPVDVNAWGASQRPAMMDEYSNAVKQMAEQAGVGGVRYGSGLQNSIANYGGQMMNKYNADLADKWLQSQESAMGRAMSGAGAYSQLGLGAQQAGGEGLANMGSLYSQLPLQVAQMMGGLGSQLTNQQIDPWTQMLTGLIGNTGATPTTYTPSAFQSFLQNFGAGLPYASNNQQYDPWLNSIPRVPTSAIDMTGTGGIL